MNRLKGVIEDVLVKVDIFIFPIDFIMLVIKDDKVIPIILGQPFFGIGRALINVQKGELTIRVHDQKINFNVFRSMEYPITNNDVDGYFHVDVIDNIVEDMLMDTHYNDHL